MKIIGPGYYLLLLHGSGKAVFAWRVFIDDCPGQTGVNCCIFRNEGAGRSSDLIREADARAEERWPGERHYTYVDPEKVSSGLPGYCFLRAGWRYAGWTASGKRILEKPGNNPLQDRGTGLRKRIRPVLADAPRFEF